MSTYIMSDIHGCYDDFIKMLKNIEFNENDQLILAGDYIDRGSQNLEMLRWMENTPDNVLLIKGNHDIEFAQCISIVSSIIKKLKISVNNNNDLQKVYSVIKYDLKIDMFDYYGTLKHLIFEKHILLSDLELWERIINDMPYYFKIRINKCKHIITHAGYIDKEKYNKIKNLYNDIESFYVYAREESMQYGGEEDTIIIFGHTPTIIYSGFYNNGYIYKHINKENNCTFYNIDCGKSYYSEKYKNAKLACIRLEDKKAFYI